MPDDGLLQWMDDRWHLDGQPIHAGRGCLVRDVDGKRWHTARFESKDRGRILMLYISGPDGWDYGRAIANANDGAHTLHAPVSWGPPSLAVDFE